MESPPAKSSTKKHSLVILRHDLDAAAIHWTRTGFIFVHAGPNLCQLILKSAQWCLSTKHKRNHSRNSPSKFSGGLHQQKYWKENLQNGWSRISQIFWPLAICTSNGLNKRKLWKVPLMNVLALYLYTLKNKKVSPKKNPLVNFAWLSSCKMYHHHFNFQRSNCVLRVWRISPNPPFLSPKIQQGAPSRQQQFPLGSCLAFCWLPFVSGWGPTWVTWPYTSSTTRLIPSASSPPRISYRCENLANFVPSMAFLCSLEAALP